MRLILPGLLLAIPLLSQEVLPAPPKPFAGEIGLKAQDSKPDFPRPVEAPKGSPNILLILLDDVGFSAPGSFGGPVSTPTLDRLAKSGLRYNQFHTTALCSPTRAALITGRNHHSVHTAAIMEGATGFPGYDSLMGKDTATIAEVLKQKGWSTAWFGKNHNVPDWQNSQAGPFERWPTSLGFDHFYGFIGGDTHQWRPNLTEGTKPIEPYLSNKNYHLDDDLADQAVRWIQMQKAVAPDRPFFVYYAPGATHAPHHARKEFVDKYKGKFDQGWDQVRQETFERQKKMGVIPPGTRLTARHSSIPAWSSLDADQKQVCARMMEIYAGFLEQTDYNAGRVIDAVERLGQLDNTLVIYIAGDNGASGEGGPQGLLNEMTFFNGFKEDGKEVLRRIDELGTWTTYNHYPAGWAHAMDTPFQWTKQMASHYGGTRNGMVISWPARIKAKDQFRTQWHHVIDITPTILEVTGIEAPSAVNGVAQKPIEGVSIAYTFDSPASPSTRRTQYFEMLGNRAIYHDGWIAATTPAGAPWDPGTPEVDVITGYNWELYHVAGDFSQSNDLAKQNPAKLRELQWLFYAEAARHNVLPFDNSKTARLDPAIRPSLTRGRNVFTYNDNLTRIPEAAAPDIKNKSFTIAAEINVPANAASGVIVTQGGLFGGWGLLLEQGKPVFHYNTAGIANYAIGSQRPLTPGKHTIVFDFRYDGGGLGKGGSCILSVDGAQVAQGRIEKTLPIRITLDEGLDVGQDTGTPVVRSYDVPNAFPGKIEKVRIEIKPVGAVPQTGGL